MGEQVFCDEATFQALADEISALQAPTAPDYLRLDEGGRRISVVASAYMTAYDFLARTPTERLPPELQRQQAALLGMGPRSPWTVAGMVATCLCAALEDFLSRRTISDTIVAKVQSGEIDLTRPDRKKLPAKTIDPNPKVARGQIRSACKPTANIKHDGWLANVKAVYAVQPSAAVHTGLSSLTWHRNEFVHGGYAGDPLDVPGDTLLAWQLSTLLLGALLVGAEGTPNPIT